MAAFRRLRSQFQTRVDERDRVGDVARAQAKLAEFSYTSAKIYDKQGRRDIAEKLLGHAALFDPANALIVERQALWAYQAKRFNQR